MELLNEYAMIQQIKLPYIKTTSHYDILKIPQVLLFYIRGTYHIVDIYFFITFR